MNIKELRDRLTIIIDENNSKFPDENRNQHPVFVDYRLSKRVHCYAPIEHAESSLYGFKGDKNGFVLHIDDTAILEYGHNSKRIA